MKFPAPIVAMASLLLVHLATAQEAPGSIETIPRDLVIPELSDEPPAPGKRVRESIPNPESHGCHHLLYLPTNWKPDGTYPVIFEYPGNRYKTSPGTQEGCELGYGISGGRDVIWVCLPFVDPQEKQHATQWWGDAEATVTYAKKAVQQICSRYGGNPGALFLAGFSRGAIACNYIGLHDDEIAALWKGFLCHSHYDGVRKWSYPESDRASAMKRLKRLEGRPQFISHEKAVATTADYLKEVYPKGNFTFLNLPFREHTASWVLRDIPARQKVREWFWNALVSQ